MSIVENQITMMFMIMTMTSNLAIANAKDTYTIKVSAQ